MKKFSKDDTEYQFDDILKRYETSQEDIEHFCSKARYDPYAMFWWQK